MKLLDDDAHTIWMQHHQVLKEQTGLLVKANDIEKQRLILSPLSNQLIETVDRFRVKPETVFVAYCPMAIEDKGAYWLSEFEEIRNPYFGDAMLTCGEVRKKISMKGKTESKTSQPQGHQH
jgi:membrane fusion protein, copper/silver efflux system